MWYNDRMFNASEFKRKGIVPPAAKRALYAHTYHGERIEDPYHWLKDRNDPDVIPYLAAENAYTEAVMADTKELQERLYKEILSRIKETDMSVPERIDDWYYYARTEEGKQYPIHCRKKILKDAEGNELQIETLAEEIIFDENQEAAGQEFFSLGALSISPNHELLAYSVNYTGDEMYTLHFKNLTTGEKLPDTASNLSSGFEWANDNTTYFYGILDKAKRPYKIFRGVLGTTLPHVLVYHEPDERFLAYVDKTRDEKYIFIYSDSKNTSEAHYISADSPTDNPKLFLERREEIEYAIDHHDAGFYMITNEGAVNSKVLFAKHGETETLVWEEFIPHDPTIKIDDIDCFKNFLVLSGRASGLPFVRLYSIEKKSWQAITFDEAAYVLEGGGNPEYHTNTYRFVYSSLITPASVYDYDMKTGERILRKQEEVHGGYSPMLYQIERIETLSHDGIRVPISLVYRKELFRHDGTNPMYLAGYGSYGISYDTWFSASRVSLLDRGFVIAYCHPRGGGEFGRTWYYEGRLMKKKNTFLDFIACAEHLIKERYTSSEYLAIQGGSAGGLLMGAVVNLRPDLFKAVVAKVPFVDTINTMMDPSLPLTVGEYEDWGNPNERPVFDYIKSYSPYDNVQVAAYPHMLVLAGLNDPRVAYWEPAKWVAKLRGVKTDDNILLLKTNMGAGHGGPSGRYDYLKEIAFEYSFVLKALGVNP